MPIYYTYSSSTQSKVSVTLSRHALGEIVVATLSQDDRDAVFFIVGRLVRSSLVALHSDWCGSA